MEWARPGAGGRAAGRRAALLLLALVLAAPAGCGLKGAPEAPEGSVEPYPLR